MTVNPADSLDRLGMDGAKWAHEFKLTAERLGHTGMDEGWLIGWFCNAVMAGYDEAERHHRAIRRAHKEPDYCFNPEDWEYTQPWDARHELAESILDYGQDKIPVRVSTLITGPDKWVARIPLDTDGDGETDDWECQWFETEEAARAALTAALSQGGAA